MNIKNSTFIERNGILIVKIGADINEAFINEIFEVDISVIRLAIIATDNSFDKTLGYTIKVAEKIKKQEFVL